MLCSALLLAGCSPEDAPAPVIPEEAQAGELTGMEACEYQPGGSKTKYTAECGTLVVPENWDKADSRLIALPVVPRPPQRAKPRGTSVLSARRTWSIEPSWAPPDWLFENHDVRVRGLPRDRWHGDALVSRGEHLLKTHVGKDLLSEQARKEYAAAVKQCAVTTRKQVLTCRVYTVPRRHRRRRSSPHCAGI